jgi:hypothetical protein
MLFGTYEGALVDVWVDFNVRVVAELEGILELSASRAGPTSQQMKWQQSTQLTHLL